MAAIKVVEGDVAKQDWHIEPQPSRSIATPVRSGLWFKTERVDLADDVERLEAVDEANQVALLGAAGWGAAGALLFGPLGALGGALLGGRGKRVAFACFLKDGRKFLATTDGDTWLRLQAMRTFAPPPAPPAAAARFGLPHLAAACVAIGVALYLLIP